jgi:hypothetical protein
MVARRCLHSAAVCVRRVAFVGAMEALALQLLHHGFAVSRLRADWFASLLFEEGFESIEVRSPECSRVVSGPLVCATRT